MKQIQAFALFLALLLIPGWQSDVQAARRQKAPAPAQPVVEVMDAFRQYVQADPFLADKAQKDISNQIEKYLDDLLNRKDKAEYIEKNSLRP